MQPYRLGGGFAGLRPGTLWFWFVATLWVVRFFWQCLLGGRLGPPFFPAGKESAAGGVKKGGQGGLPNGPLDDPPTATRGPRPPFWIIPRGSVGAVPGECAGALAEFASACCGARRFAVARFRRELVLRVGSSGENVGAALVFELWGLLAVVLRQRVASLGSSLASLEGCLFLGVTKRNDLRT